MQYTLIVEEGPCALILCGEDMTQYAVVHGLDKETGCYKVYPKSRTNRKYAVGLEPKCL